MESLKSNSLVKTDVSGYVRDSSTGSIINMNEEDYMRYTREKNTALQQKMINQKVDQLAETVSEMKEILKLLVNKHHGS